MATSWANNLAAELESTVTGEVARNARLDQFTTLRVGGPAAVLVRAESVGDLVAIARACATADRPWLIVGRGSNLLIADRGWPGVAVTLGRGFRGVDADQDALRDASTGEQVAVVAGAAEPMPVLATAVAGLGLGGLAFGVAIPGTLGGAVRMNAGAHGADVSGVLEWADAVRLSDDGNLTRFTVADLAPQYRSTRLPADAVVIRAGLRLTVAETGPLAQEMAHMRQWRREHQPVNEPSCGSVFRNPTGDSAGRLIEAAGMKHHRVGGATVSAVHANFITVEPAATAGDVAQVIHEVAIAVRDRQGVALELEVVLAGFDPTEGESCPR